MTLFLIGQCLVFQWQQALPEELRPVFGNVFGSIQQDFLRLQELQRLYDAHYWCLPTPQQVSETFSYTPHSLDHQL